MVSKQADCRLIVDAHRAGSLQHGTSKSALCCRWNTAITAAVSLQNLGVTLPQKTSASSEQHTRATCIKRHQFLVRWQGGEATHAPHFNAQLLQATLRSKARRTMGTASKRATASLSCLSVHVI
eukprot:2917-Pleurochrysis_carterae.AAC.4